jgi:hypothetical protein
MKQLLPLFLFLLPCFALAQYPSNGNQKITLGEQTTADGLIYRGVAATDTVRKSSIDTMAYMVLDTTTNIIWHYKKATSNAWLRLNLLPSDTASMLTNYWRAGRFSGVLPLLNGGTGASVRTFVDTINTQTVNGAKTFTSAVTATRFNPTANTATGTGIFLPATNTLGFSTNGTNKMTIDNNGNVGFLLTPENSSGAWRNLQFQNGNFAFRANIDTDFFVGSNFLFKTDNSEVYKVTGAMSRLYYINDEIRFQRATSGTAGNNINFLQTARFNGDGDLWIGYTSDNGAYPLQVNGTIYAAGTTYPSDERYKENIIPLNKGLDLINKLKPVTFNYINTTENNFSEFEEIGFIAQDVDRALSTESFVKSIVKYTDESNTDSKMVFSPQNLIPILTKAIQEQQALIKALEQRIINLENK